MKRELEDSLWSAFGRKEGQTMRDLIDEFLAAGLIQNPKQAWRTLSKWSRQGKYDWGTVIDMGWKVKPVKKIEP